MRKNTKAVIEAFLSGKSNKKSDAIWTDGHAIYSYGTCLLAPLADRTGFAMNETKYSPTTSRHQHGLRVGLEYTILRAVVIENAPRGVSATRLAELGAAKKTELLDPAQGAF